jgi:hypothetical protein
MRIVLHPVLHPGRYAFVAIPAGQPIDAPSVVACIRESEGMSVILAEEDALSRGLPSAFTAAWITLTVMTDLSAVGLTAAFSTALAQAGISCNSQRSACSLK